LSQKLVHVFVDFHGGSNCLIYMIIFFYSFDQQVIKICPMQLFLGHLENDPLALFVVYAANAMSMNLVPQDSNL